MSTAEECRKNITSMLYAAAYPVSKCNMDRVVLNLSAAWLAGIPCPAHGGVDEFLRVRVGGIPAGVKLYVAPEVCKRLHLMVCCSPNECSDEVC